LGTPDEAVLNQKNSTSLTLGTQTAFDFHPPADLTPRFSRRLYPPAPAGLNGARKNLSNLLLLIVGHNIKVFSKPSVRFKSKAQTDPPSLKRAMAGQVKKRSPASGGRSSTF
jgi:hypothetical protein